MRNEFRVNTYATNNQQYPSVASLLNGNFVVTWQSKQDPNYGIYGQLNNPIGGPLGNEFRVNTLTTSSQNLPKVAGLFNGNFVVTWESDGQDPGGSYDIYGQLFDSTALVTIAGSTTQAAAASTGSFSTTTTDMVPFSSTAYPFTSDPNRTTATRSISTSSGTRVTTGSSGLATSTIALTSALLLQLKVLSY